MQHCACMRRAGAIVAALDTITFRTYINTIIRSFALRFPDYQTESYYLDNLHKGALTAMHRVRYSCEAQFLFTHTYIHHVYFPFSSRASPR